MLLDFHAHTLNSDGGNSMLEMARQAERLGLGALIITNHDHPRPDAFASDRAERRTLAEVEQLTLPIIIGAEIWTPYGECLLFGEEAIDNWYLFKDRLKRLRQDFNDTLWVETFNRYVLQETSYSMWCGHTLATYGEPLPYAMILCHPRMKACYLEATPPEFFKLLHGFEIQNNHEEYDQINPETVDFLRRRVGGRELRDSDAHGIGTLGYCRNEVDIQVATESDIIGWLRGSANA